MFCVVVFDLSVAVDFPVFSAFDFVVVFTLAL